MFSSTAASEERILGGAIADAFLNEFPTVLNRIKAELPLPMWTDRRNKDLLSILLHLEAEGQPFYDPVAIHNEAARLNLFQDMAGQEYITRIIQNGMISGLDYHFNQVKKAAFERDIQIFKAVIAELPAEGFSEAAAAALLAFREKMDDHTGRIISSFQDVFRAAYKDLEDVVSGKKPKGLPTGFRSIDDHTGGMRAGELWILGGRPGTGKTALAGNMAIHCGVGVLFISLEMVSLELVKRSISDLSGVDFGKLRTGNLDSADFSCIANAGRKSYPIFYSEKATMTIDDIIHIAQTLKIKQEIGLVIIDYLQLITPRDRALIREQQVAEITRRLKLAAIDLGLPILCLSQLNRESEKRFAKIPMLSDLRESGAIEQDADVVAFLTRGESENEIIFRIEKARNGRTGKALLYFDGSHQRFRSIARQTEHN